MTGDSITDEMGYGDSCGRQSCSRVATKQPTPTTDNCEQVEFFEIYGKKCLRLNFLARRVADCDSHVKGLFVIPSVAYINLSTAV